MNKHNIPLLFVTFLLASRTLAGPLIEEERKIVRDQIPTRQIDAHPRMAELMSWAIDESEEMTVLRGLADISRLKITELSGQVMKLLEDDRPVVRVAAIQTLGDLDARQSADRLLEFARATAWNTDIDIDQTRKSDALIARWNDRRGVAAWTQRLRDARNPLSLRISAAAALGAGIDANEAARRALLTVVLDENEPLPLRVLAAQSIGTVISGGLEAEAGKLSKLSDTGRLLAASLLRTHSGGPALDLLTRFANDKSPAVQALAMQRLMETEPQRLWTIASTLFRSPDPKVRLLMVKASKPWRDPQAVRFLSAAINDPHPDVRHEARQALHHLAKTHQDLNQPVKDAVRKWLATAVTERAALADYEPKADPEQAKHWRAAEQAAMLAGDSGDKAANADLLKLIAADQEHPRLEVRIAAVDAVRKLHLPESRRPMVDLMDRLVKRMVTRSEWIKQQRVDTNAPNAINNKADSQFAAKAAETLGVWGVTEADPILRMLIPKHAPSNAYPNARSAAIWALGMLHKGKPEPELAAAFVKRLHDLNPLDPEAHDVRLHACIAIGRMKAVDMVEFIQGRYDVDGLAVKAAARWAYHEITGQRLPEIKLARGLIRDGFIQPLD